MQHWWRELSPSLRLNATAAACAVITICLVLLVQSCISEISLKRKHAQLKQNVHAIQLAVERYAVDDPNSYYPREIEDVIQRGYLEQFPNNPLTGLPMQPAASEAEATPGDFFYLKRYGPHGPAESDGNPTGYSLMLYL